jgi:cytochrome c biogenesis protein CcmG/thiol:disulfide interchange protein DsbE
MKKLLVVFMLILSGCATEAMQPEPSTSLTLEDCSAFENQTPVANSELPNVEVECLRGSQRINLSTLRGPLLIPIWASWCQPCKEEMPLVQEFRDKHGDVVEVLGLALLDESTQAEAGSLNWGVTLASIEDPDGVLRPALNIQAPPTTLFISRNGEIVFRKFGAVTSLAELETLAEQYFDVTL